MEEVLKYVVSHEDDRQCLILVKSNSKYETRRSLLFDIYVLQNGSLNIRQQYCRLYAAAEIEHDDPSENYMHIKDVYSSRTNCGDGSYAVRCLYSFAHQVDVSHIDGFISWVDTEDAAHASRLKSFWTKMGFHLTPKKGFGEMYDIRSDEIGNADYMQEDFIAIPI